MEWAGQPDEKVPANVNLNNWCIITIYNLSRVNVHQSTAVNRIPEIAGNTKTAVVGQKWIHSNKLKTPF